MFILPPAPPAIQVLSEPYPLPPPAPVITRRVDVSPRLRVRRIETQPLPQQPPVALQVAELLARVALSGFARGGHYLISQEDLHLERPRSAYPGARDASPRWVMREGPWAPIPYPAPGQR